MTAYCASELIRVLSNRIKAESVGLSPPREVFAVTSRTGYFKHPVTYVVLCYICILALSLPVGAQEPSFETWTIPGGGASLLRVNPGDGSVWTICHQSGNIVALDGTDGSAMLDLPFTMRPTALDFTPDGAVIFVVGEPSNDQVITEGVIQALDTSSGAVLGELGVEGACNAAYCGDDGVLFVACGMQYAYQGILYRIAWRETEDGGIAMEVVTQAECGKIPWAIAEFDGNLYVTDLELQWTAQADGSEGPPYGSYVWSYDAVTLGFLDRSWVGINPNRLGVTSGGVLAACSGSKQTEGDVAEPTLSLIEAPGESEPVYLGSTGASDLAVDSGGELAVATLADWGPPAPWSAMAVIQNYMPGSFDDAHRWLYTGDIGIFRLVDGEIISERMEVLEEGYFRAVAIALDGSVIYALKGESDLIYMIPIEGLISE